MVNHNNEHEDDAYVSGGSWAVPLAGLLIGLLIGGLTGAVAMLFLAPQSGKESRAKMQQLSHELREQA
jgi:YtxH-like protein